MFLDAIIRCRPDLPLLILTDFDPDGINISRCYLQGSEHTQTDRPKSSLRWFGIRETHLLHAGVLSTRLGKASSHAPAIGSFTSESDSASTIHSASSQGRPTFLTLRDHKFIADSLKRQAGFQERGDKDFCETRRELQIMQLLGYKAEIQLLDESGDLTSFLDCNIALALSKC